MEPSAAIPTSREPRGDLTAPSPYAIAGFSIWPRAAGFLPDQPVGLRFATTAPRSVAGAVRQLPARDLALVARQEAKAGATR